MDQQNYFLYTFGCAMNEYDSERMASVIESRGYMLVNDVKNADLIILNTCSVREKPQIKISSYLGVINKVKAKNRKVLVGIAGCVAQNLGESILKDFKIVDFVIGTEVMHRFNEILERAENGERFSDTSLMRDEFTIDGFDRKNSVSSLVTIMKGCENFCSYCIVPYVRGKEISRNPNEIEDEIKRLVDNGVKEVTLLGQNVNSYGRGLRDEIDFASLLARVNKIDGIKRIRFLTSHPKDFNERLIDTIASLDKVCKYIHLPIQSGSDRILSLMERSYTAAEYLKKIEYARKVMNDIGFSSDFIVAFPTESVADFKDTLSLIEEVEFDHVFAFIYSKRPGTKAYDIIDTLDGSEKSDRLNRLFEVKDKIMDRRLMREVGKTTAVLVTGISKKNDGEYTGKNQYNRNINFSSSMSLEVGSIVDVKITEAKRNSLNGIKI